ncbi:MAG: type I polyketide synthase, partial [Myxococcales bacterium]|nr:type I polyketide synthase [Myxococcales bacterium]
MLPDTVVGHSLGEAAAAHASGALTLGDAALVVFHRSRLMLTTEGQGATAVIGLQPAPTAARIAGRGGDLAVAGNNSPGTTVVSGTGEAIDALVAELSAEGIFARRIVGVRTAFHGPQMDPVQGALTAALAEIEPRAAQVPMVSTVDAAPIPGPALNAHYWGRNVREPFRFAEVVAQLAGGRPPLFIEIAPHRLLATAIRQTARDAQVVVSMHRGTPGGESMAMALADVFTRGVDVAADALAPPGPRAHDLPHYPWQRQRYWLEQIPVHDPPTVPWMQDARLDPGAHPLLGNGLAVIGDGRQIWRNAVSAGSPAWVGDHRALGRVIFPGAGFAEIAAGAATAPGQPITVADLRFVEALSLAGGRRAIQVQRVPGPTGEAVQIFSRADTDAPWQLHAEARIEPAEALASSPDLDALRAACREAVEPEAHYARMAGLGLDYGPAFRTVRAIHTGAGEVLGRVELDDLADAGRHHLHPALLDGCFQLAVHLGDGEQSRLPERVDRIALAGRPASAVWCHLRVVEGDDPALMRVDLLLFDDEGVVADVRGLGLRAIEAGRGIEAPAASMVHTLDWVPDAHAAPPTAAGGRWLVVAEAPLAGALKKALEARRAAAVVTAEPAALDDATRRAALFEAVKAGPDWRGIVFSPGPDGEPGDAAL